MKTSISVSDARNPSRSSKANGPKDRMGGEEGNTISFFSFFCRLAFDCFEEDCLLCLRLLGDLLGGRSWSGVGGPGGGGGGMGARRGCRGADVAVGAGVSDVGIGEGRGFGGWMMSNGCCCSCSCCCSFWYWKDRSFMSA